ncbi:LacI family transcriptional regulator [Celeribacter indicus]|uniref:LacI family transcriptional regulator n=1 Tax=Celeribacter indicus TaxID=1208324 RepID=A0A0B5E645_9RHOB|nr:LacI family transcriptional regulator [Celeribacter indicus]
METVRRSRDNARVTISDLSQALSLTKGTISRALNGYPDISEATRIRVIRAAQAMGYRPLSHAQAIRTGRSQSLALVIHLAEPDAYRPFLAEFLAGLTQAASAEGWTITIATADTEADSLRLMRDLVQERKADGFILPRVHRDDPRIAALAALDTPFICYGRPKDAERMSFFDIDSEAAMSEAVGKLAALGHRRIGYIGSAQSYAFSHHRHAGYRAGLALAGMDPAPELVEAAVSREESVAAAAALLRLARPPTAILCATDVLASGVYDAAAAAGLEIGADLSVIGYDNAPEAQAMWPRLATFAVDNRAAGAALGRMLIARITEPEHPPSQMILPAEFRPGGSIGQPARTPEQLAQHLARRREGMTF